MKAFSTLLLDNTLRISLILAIILLIRKTEKISRKDLITIWILVFILGFSPFRVEVPLLNSVETSKSQDASITLNRDTDSLEKYRYIEDEDPKTESFDTEKILLTVYGTGILCLASYQLYRYAVLRKGIRSINNNSDNKEVICIPGNTGSFVTGIIHPVICCSEEDMHNDLILAHERMHIRNHDPLKKTLSFLFLLTYWFDPLVWYAVSCFEKDLEMNCDDEVIAEIGEGKKAEYMQTILDRSIEQRGLSLLHFSRHESTVKDRLEHLVSKSQPKNRTLSLIICTAAIVIIGFFAVRGGYREYRIESPEPFQDRGSICFTLPRSCQFTETEADTAPAVLTLYDKKNDILVDVMIEYSLTDEDLERYPCEEDFFAKNYLSFEPGLLLEALSDRERPRSKGQPEELGSTVFSKTYSLEYGDSFYTAGIYEHDYLVWRIVCRTPLEKRSQNERVMKKIIADISFKDAD